MVLRSAAPLARVALTLLAIALAACAAPADGSEGAGARLLVQNGRAQSLSLLEPFAVRPVTELAKVGAFPAYAAGVRGGAIVVTRGATAQDGTVLVVTAAHGSRAGPAAGTVAVQRVRLEDGAAPALVSSDGRRFAAVAYGRPGKSATRPVCRVAIVDTHALSVVSVADLCDDAGRHEVVALAVLPGEGDQPRNLRVLAAWRRVAALGETDRGFLTLLRGETAAVSLGIELPAAPRTVMVAGAGPAARVYCTVAPSDDDPDESDRRQWLLGFEPDALSLESAAELPGPLSGFVVAPDGAFAYALTPMARAGVAELHLESGSVRRLAGLPSYGLGVAVTAEHLLVPAIEGNVVWLLDRRTGRTLRSIPVSPGTLGLTPL